MTIKRDLAVIKGRKKLSRSIERMITAAEGIGVGFLLVNGVYEFCNFCGFMFETVVS